MIEEAVEPGRSGIGFAEGGVIVRWWMAGDKGLELDEDRGFQRWEWRVQRTGWVGMAVILVLAILGLLGGPGILSEVVWGKAGEGVWVEGRRVERHHRPTEVVFHVADGAGSGGRMEVWVEGSFLEKMKMERVVPEPVEVRREGARLVMTVMLEGKGREVKVEMEPEEVGSSRARVGVTGVGAVEIRQWVLP